MSSFDFEDAMTENAINMSYVGAGMFVCAFIQVSVVCFDNVCVCMRMNARVCMCLYVCVFVCMHKCMCIHASIMYVCMRLPYNLPVCL